MTSNADIASSRVGGILPDDSRVVLGVDRAFGGNWRVDWGGRGGGGVEPAGSWQAFL